MEFALLFFAVYLGFLTENLRSENADRQMEKFYISSLLKNLMNDTSELNVVIQHYDSIIAQQKILLRTFSKLEAGFSSEFDSNLFSLYWHPDFIYTDATLQQMKYSGGFRLIRNSQLVNKILEYDAIVALAKINEQILARSLEKNHSQGNEIYNWQEYIKRESEGQNSEQLEREKFDILLTHDSYVTGKFFNQIRLHNIFTKQMREQMLEVKVKCLELMKFIEDNNIEETDLR